MRFSPTFLDDLRERVPISSIIGQRVAFDRKKTNASRGDFWGCCPFHGEKSPSFHCEDPKGRYHCFGCGVSGDHFRFMTELDGISFPEAVERVAAMAGVALPQETPQEREREARRATLAEAMDLSVAHFQQQLQSSDGAKARAYLRGRGLSAATIETFRLGYAPDSRNGLKNHLASHNVPKDVIEASGMVVTGDDVPVSFDRFRDRIMFPIEDSRGRTIAFGGRAMGEGALAKYLNSPETELFHKGRVLYNFARARTAARDAGTIIAVEGYMDVIALAQSGIAHVVAPLGTALTEDQVDLLWRAVDVPVLCFDGDQAGQRAAFRAVDVALARLKPGKSLRFAVLPDGKDPDDLVRDGGRDAFEKVIAASRPLADMLWSREAGQGELSTPEARADLEARLKRLIGTIADEGVRRHYLQDLRDRLQGAFAPQRQTASRASSGPGAGKPVGGRLTISQGLAQSALVSGVGQAPLGEVAIIVAAFSHPRLVEDDPEHFERLAFSDADLSRLRMVLLDMFAEGEPVTAQSVQVGLARHGLAETYARLELRVRSANLWSVLPAAAIEDARVTYDQAVSQHLKRSALTTELRRAERDAGELGDEEALARVMTIRAELNHLAGTDALIDGFGILSGRAKRS